MKFFKEEKFITEVEIGLTDDFAPLVSPLARRIDVSTDVVNPKGSYVMQIFVPKEYASLKIDCRSSSLYPTKRTITPKYRVYEEAINCIRKSIKDDFPDITFETIRTSTVRDGGKHTDRYEANFLACPVCNGSAIPEDIDELPLLVSLLNSNTAKIKYSNKDYMIKTKGGNIELTNSASGTTISKPQF